MSPGLPNDFLKRRLEAASASLSPTPSSSSTAAAAMAAAAKRVTAGHVRDRLVARIAAFDKSAGEGREVWIHLVSLGSTFEFIPTSIGVEDPQMIYFEGVGQDDAEMVLLQHVSQVNVLLVSHPKPDPNVPKRRMGFEAPTPAPAAPESTE